MSINVSSRNAALLTPLIFMLIADKVTKTSISLQENKKLASLAKSQILAFPRLDYFTHPLFG